MPLAARAGAAAHGGGVGDGRHAGVADDGDGLAGDDALDVLLRALVLGVLVEALGRGLDAEVREELARVARVFAEDERRRLQRLGGARGKVAEVAERRAYDEELAGHAAECTSRASSSLSATIFRDSSSGVGRSTRSSSRKRLSSWCIERATSLMRGKPREPPEPLS